MEWLKIVLPVLVIVSLFVFFTILHKKNNDKKIKIVVDEILSQGKFNEFHKVTHLKDTYLFENETTTFLIRIVLFVESHELIVTNPIYWCINDNPKKWNRSVTPVTIPGAKEFNEFSLSNDKALEKVVVIYPNCHNKTYYINESDVLKIIPTKKVYKIFFLTFDEIKDFFNS